MMKKITLLTCLCLIIGVKSHAQLANGSIAPDWTLTDINGTSHNLYSNLNAGKTVYMDVSATWCGPCWYYHTTKALDSLWEFHGPTGGGGVASSTTNDVNVFFIEGDGSTGTKALNGINGVDGVTLGNWVSGVHHPIIDPPSALINGFNSSYAIGYFPTIYMVCPDRTIKEVGRENAVSLYKMKSACSVLSTGLDARIMSVSTGQGNANNCDSVRTSIRLANNGTTALADAIITYKVDGVTQKTYAWTGSLASYNSLVINGIKVGSSLGGNHTLKIIVSKPNGGTDVNDKNDTISTNFVVNALGTLPLTESFESVSLPSSSWSSTHSGATGNDWTISSNSGATGTHSAMINNLSNTAGNMSYLDNINRYDLSALTSPSLTFKIAYQRKTSANNEKLQLLTSTNCGATWITRWTKAGANLATVTSTSSTPFVPTANDFVKQTINLPSLAGSSNVMFRWLFTADASSTGNNIYLDDINLAESVNSVEDLLSTIHLNVYPNPSLNGIVNVSFNLPESHTVYANITDVLGRTIENIPLKLISGGETNFSIGNSKPYQAGIYFLNLNIDGKTISQKLIIE